MSIFGKNKILVIGLDGADFRYVKPLLKKGRLPNLKKMMLEGAYSEIETTVPPISPSAWMSLATGKFPVKHGIFTFDYPKDNLFKETRFMNSGDLKAKTLWELLSGSGRSSVVIDVPMQYPPLPIKGVVISRFLAESLNKAFYPLGLLKDLKRRNLVFKDPSLQFCGDHSLRSIQSVRGYGESIEAKVRLVKHLGTAYPWDLFFVIFQNLDFGSHIAWRRQSEIHSIYEKLDWAVGEIVGDLGMEAVRVVVSDHGFSSVVSEINVNELLFKLGYLPKTISGRALKYCLDTGKITRGRKIGGKETVTGRINYKYDPVSSTAYCASRYMYGINVNLIGRNPFGKVPLRDYDRLCRRIIKDLRRAEDPLQGGKLFERVWKNEYPVKADDGCFPPDIYFIPSGMKYRLKASLGASLKGEVCRRETKPAGFHSMRGIFMISGEGIKHGELKRVPRLVDLAPTFLHILGLPVPEDMDGRILRDIFKRSSYLSAADHKETGPSVSDHRPHEADPGARWRIYSRLRSLGYL